MYASAQFGTAFGVADLPAGSNLEVNIDGFVFNPTKTGTTGIVYTGSWAGYDVDIQEGWRLVIKDFGGPGLDAVYDFNCIPSDTMVPGENPPGSPTDVSIRDLFSDMLVASFEYGGESVELPLLRGDPSICCWSSLGFFYDGEFIPVTACYVSVADLSISCKFVYSVGSDSGIKVDPQDQPNGTYSDGEVTTNFVIS